MSDLQIDGAERSRRTTSDGEDNLVGPTPLDVIQTYEPSDSETSIDDLVEGAKIIAQAEDWNLEQEDDIGGTENRWCGTKPDNKDRICIFISTNSGRHVTILLTTNSFQP